MNNRVSAAASNSETIAHYVAGAMDRTPPPKVADTARLCLADWIAVCVGAYDEPAARTVHSVSKHWPENGGATLLLGGTSNALMAALCNGTLAHCLDFDDTYVSANTHTSAPLWAATLALGEEIHAEPKAMLAAFIAGFEVAARAGSGLGEAVTARGWHATGAFGRLGAAAACSSLLRLDAPGAMHALGAAATQISGLVGSFGTMSKPFHAGRAAMDGVMSARLAAGGFKAATGLLEPNGGLDSALIQDRAERIRPADFSQWELLNNSFKPYAACHLGHPAINAAQELALTSEDLERTDTINVYVGELAYQVIGGKSGVPATPLEAKFDLKYCVSLGLTGSALSAADFLQLPDPNGPVVRLAKKVQLHPADDCGYTSARIEVSFVDGSTRSHHVSVAKGHPGNPMTWTDMWSKFDALVRPVLGARSEEIFEEIRRFGSDDGQSRPLLKQVALGG